VSTPYQILLLHRQAGLEQLYEISGVKECPLRRYLWNVLILAAESTWLTCRCDIRDVNIMEIWMYVIVRWRFPQTTRIRVRKASAGLNPLKTSELFAFSNSHDKNIYPQLLFVIYEWSGRENQYYYESKIRKQVERDIVITEVDSTLLVWCLDRLNIRLCTVWPWDPKITHIPLIIESRLN